MVIQLIIERRIEIAGQRIDNGLQFILVTLFYVVYHLITVYGLYDTLCRRYVIIV